MKNQGLRIFRDVLWIMVFLAATVALYTLFAGVQEVSTLTLLLMALGLVGGILLAVFSYTTRLSMNKNQDVVAFDNTSGIWLLSTRDTPARVSILAVVAIPLAAGMIHAGMMDGKPSPQKVMFPKAQDDLRAVLKLNGDRDTDYVLFNHDQHKQTTGNGTGCSICHHLDRPGDINAACYHCHSDMSYYSSIFDHQTHQTRLGEKESCTACHELDKAKSRKTAKDCYQCHKKDMGIQTGQFDSMAPPYPVAMHGMCVKCHQQMANKNKLGCLACCDTCHQAVKHDIKDLDLR